MPAPKPIFLRLHYKIKSEGGKQNLRVLGCLSKKCSLSNPNRPVLGTGRDRDNPGPREVRPLVPDRAALGGGGQREAFEGGML